MSMRACVRVPGHPQTHSIPHLMISDDVRCAQRATTGMRMLTAMGAYILICRHIRLNVRATYAQAPAQATGRSIATTNAPLRTRSAAPRGVCRAGRGNSAVAFRGIAQDGRRRDERRRAGRGNCFCFYRGITRAECRRASEFWTERHPVLIFHDALWSPQQRLVTCL